MQTADDDRPSNRKMFLALAWVTPFGIPTTLGLAYTFATDWIPRDMLLSRSDFSTHLVPRNIGELHLSGARSRGSQ
jgi:hypothetical protein